MSDNEITTNELSADELDQVAGGQSSSSDSLFEASSTGGAGVKTRKAQGKVKRNTTTQVEVGIEITDDPFKP